MSVLQHVARASWGVQCDAPHCEEDVLLALEHVCVRRMPQHDARRTPTRGPASPATKNSWGETGVHGSASVVSTSEASRNPSSRRPVKTHACACGSSIEQPESIRESAYARNSLAGIAANLCFPLFPLVSLCFPWFPFVSFPSSCSCWRGAGATGFVLRPAPPHRCTHQRHDSLCAAGACAHPRPLGGRQVGDLGRAKLANA
jgi:hypothetical protein